MPHERMQPTRAIHRLDATPQPSAIRLKAATHDAEPQSVPSGSQPQQSTAGAQARERPGCSSLAEDFHHEVGRRLVVGRHEELAVVGARL
jgi:hypothetical protein